jgi:hypothetical protein
VLSAQAKPFDDFPADHVEKLKQIPEVAAFYNKYGPLGVDVLPDGAFFPTRLAFRRKTTKSN